MVKRTKSITSRSATYRNVDDEIDSMLGYQRFFQKANWEYKFTFFPKKCIISKRILWFTKAYKGSRTIHGPGLPVIEIKWLSKEEYMLKGLTDGFS